MLLIKIKADAILHVKLPAVVRALTVTHFYLKPFKPNVHFLFTIKASLGRLRTQDYLVFQ